MKRLSTVVLLLRLDKEPFSTEDDRDLTFKLLVAEGDRAEEEAALLRLPRPLELSAEDEDTFLEEEVESAGLARGFFKSALPLSGAEDKRETGDAFFVSGRVTNEEGFRLTESDDSPFDSVLIFLLRSDIEEETFRITGLPFSCCLVTEVAGFSTIRPPVLFLLRIEAAFEVTEDLARLDLELVTVESAGEDEAVALVPVETPRVLLSFTVFFALSAEATGAHFGEEEVVSKGVSIFKIVENYSFSLLNYIELTPYSRSLCLRPPKKLQNQQGPKI